MSNSRQLLLLGALALLLTLTAACGGTEAPAEEAPAETPVVEPAANAAPRVYFEDLEDGDTVPTIVELDFAAENFTIEPVGDGMVNAGRGHYHIGVDTECLPAGTVIPTADPWVHFGDGSDFFEIELSPGEHTLVLQIGDGEHRTLPDPGLCKTVTVNVSADA